MNLVVRNHIHYTHSIRAIYNYELYFRKALETSRPLKIPYRFTRCYYNT